MRGMRGLSVWRPVIVAMTAAGVLVGGMTASLAAPVTESPSPSATASPSPAPSVPPGTAGTNAGTGSGAATISCTKTSDGHLANCARPLPSSKMPSGSRDTTTLTQPVADPAALVDTRTWTTGGGNTFPGAEFPFGMVQWSPDTMPNRNAGGGYNFGDTSITGYSLTHVSGPGCGAGGDVPILPITGALPGGNPNGLSTAFTNAGEVAQAGYYSAQTNQPATITSEFTATAHSSMGRFTFPATAQAGFVVKLQDAQNGQYAPSTAVVVNDHEVAGSETSGHFCGEANNDGQQQEYTVHFDLVFDRPFTASQIITNAQSAASAIYLTFDTTSNPVVQAKVGISYVSDDNAQANWRAENPGWDFDAVRAADHDAWNTLLNRIQVSGGSYAQTQQFYSLLYKDFIQPNITSDVNGQYMGADMKVHPLPAGQHDQYGIYSGWDTFHSLAQLQAMLDPAAASDQAQSLLNYYAQDKILQQWGYLHLNNYVMVGDPAQSIIADYYAFGARDFNTQEALADMLAQATTVNDVRPGEALEDKYGFLPEDGAYGCCNAHGQVPTLLEYNSQDLALAHFARALGDTTDAGMLEARANNWENVFNPSNGLLNPRNKNGSFMPGITPTSTSRYVEGSAYEYLWNVPNNYPALFALLGGKDKVVPALREYLSQPNGMGTHALLTNEFGFGEQYALDYAGDPAGTQQAVNHIRTTMYQPGPAGLPDNDDLGANSSAFIWEMLGMYPENSGADHLVFNSPGFPHATITLPNGNEIRINAQGASSSTFYVQSMQLNDQPYNKLYVDYSTLAKGATLVWKLGTTPSTWGTSPSAAPPAYQSGTKPAVGFLSDQQVTVAPGGTTTVTLGAQNATDVAQSINTTVSEPSESTLTVTPQSGSISVPASGRGSITLTVHAEAGTPQTFYSVPISLTTGGTALSGVTLTVLVAQPGSLLTAFNNAGISNDSDVNAANFDGGGWSYSAQALAAQGVTPGSTVTVGSLSYTWPPSSPGYPDNAIASGQKVTVNAPAGTQQLGFLGAASGGRGQGLTTLTYSDGSTERYWLGFSDWTLGGGRQQPSYGNQIAITTPYRNCGRCGGPDNVATHVFSASLPVDAAKTLTSVTLPPGSTGGNLHVFSIGTSSQAMSGPVVLSLSPQSANAGDTVTVNGSGFGATQGTGYVQFVDNGVSWGAPGNAAAFHIDSWSDTAITFTVPTPSGSNGVWHVWPGTLASVTVVTGGGQTSDTGVLGITPTSNPADYYNNAGISADSNQACANYDGDGFSYSADALSQAGLTPGGSVTADGLSYTWPNAAACAPDNILAAGQTMLVNGASGATKLGLLGSSTNGSAQGTITVNYTDGTSVSSTLFFTDWAQSPANGNITVATMPYRNSVGGTSQQITMYVFAAEVAVDPSKTVASVTFPMVAGQVGPNTTAMHVLAVTTG